MAKTCQLMNKLYWTLGVSPGLRYSKNYKIIYSIIFGSKWKDKEKVKIIYSPRLFDRYPMPCMERSLAIEKIVHHYIHPRHH